MTINKSRPQPTDYQLQQRLEEVAYKLQHLNLDYLKVSIFKAMHEMAIGTVHAAISALPLRLKACVQ